MTIICIALLLVCVVLAIRLKAQKNATEFFAWYLKKQKIPMPTQDEIDEGADQIVSQHMKKWQK